MTLKVSVTQRRARLLRRHQLAVPAATVTAAAEAMVALHATDPWTVYLSGRARLPSATVEDMDVAIYAERALVRMLGMRRTMWVVPTSLLPSVQRGCTDDVARRLRGQLAKDLAAGGVGDGDAAGWLRDVEAGVLRALAARGSAPAAELSADEPRLRTRLVYAADKSYGGAVNITSRVLMLMSADGLIVRGHRRGGHGSGQFSWHLADAWLRGGTGANSAADSASGPDAVSAVSAAGGDGGAGGARVELARRWLRSFGPAPVSDLQWWAGWTGGQTRAALAALDVREVDLDGHDGLVLADDLEFPAEDVAWAEAAPAAVLLAALDPTPMGWRSRDWYLGPHAPRLFDRTGNIGPTLWWAGRVVGGWAQRQSGEIVFRLLEDIGSDGAASAAAAAASLEAWLGPARVTPRFRTPLERELSA